MLLLLNQNIDIIKFIKMMLNNNNSYKKHINYI